MKLICLFLMICNFLEANSVEFLTMKFVSKASYQVEQTPYRKIAFTGIEGDQLKQIDHWIFDKLSKISDLELIRPEIANPAVNLLLNIQGHTSSGLKKLKKLLGAQALLQGKLEIFIRKNLEVSFELYLYDLNSGIRVNTISRNWTIPVKSDSRQVLYDSAVTKILEEINQEWYSHSKIEEVPWFNNAHREANNIIKLINSNLFGEAFNIILKEKRRSEIQLFKKKTDSTTRIRYQLILYHLGVLHELKSRFKIARRFYDLAIRHGDHPQSNIFMHAMRRVKRRW